MPPPATGWDPNARMLCSNVFLHYCFLASLSLHSLGSAPTYLPSPHPTAFLPSFILCCSFWPLCLHHPSLSGGTSEVPFKCLLWWILVFPLLIPQSTWYHFWYLCCVLDVVYHVSSPRFFPPSFSMATMHQTPVVTGHWLTSTLKFSSSPFNDHPLPQDPPSGVARFSPLK